MTAVAMARGVSPAIPTAGSLPPRAIGAAEPVGEVSLGRSTLIKHDGPALTRRPVAVRAADPAQKRA